MKSLLMNTSSIHFLGRDYNRSTWDRLRKELATSFSVGKWEYVTLEADSLTSIACTFEHPFIQKFKTGHCSIEEGNRGNMWRWKPEEEKAEASGLHWNSLEMCSALQGRNILFMGDSMQSSFFFTYVSVVLGTTLPPRNATREEIEELVKGYNLKCEKLCEWGTSDWNHGCEMPVWVDCGELPSYSIAFVRNDNFDKKIAWTSHISRLNASILFMNTGAHYQSDVALLDNLGTAFALLATSFPNLSIFYRNTPHGHPNCHEKFHAAPSNDSRDITVSLVAFDLLQPDYHWSKFAHQNKLVLRMIEEQFPQVLIVDVASSTNLRGDSHISVDECLHYCLPGPIHSWVVMHSYALKLANQAH